MTEMTTIQRDALKLTKFASILQGVPESKIDLYDSEMFAIQIENKSEGKTLSYEFSVVNGTLLALENYDNEDRAFVAEIRDLSDGAIGWVFDEFNKFSKMIPFNEIYSMGDAGSNTTETYSDLEGDRVKELRMELELRLNGKGGSIAVSRNVASGESSVKVLTSEEQEDRIRRKYFPPQSETPSTQIGV